MFFVSVSVLFALIGATHARAQCAGGLPDCNNNGTADDCDIADGSSVDCNGNGIPDECDIADETSSDCNTDGRPDECGVADDCVVAQLETPGIAAGAWWGARTDYLEADGDTLVVGTLTGRTAYVYRLLGTRWTFEQALNPAAPSGTILFGHVVSIRNGVIVLGGRGTDCPGSGDWCGAAHVFRHDGQRWFEEQRLLPPTGAKTPHGFAAFALSTDGARVAVGALNFMEPNAVYLYQYNGSAWALEQEIGIDACNDGFRNFSASLAVDQNTLVVGDTAISCFGAGVAALCPDGGLYLYRTLGGSWFLELEVLEVCESGITSDVAGDLAVFGASLGLVGGDPAGEVLVYEFGGAAWTRTARLSAAELQPRAEFGTAVDIQGGDRILVGAPAADCPSGSECGAAYLFRRVGGSWVQDRLLLPPVRVPGARFGDAVALVEDFAFVGAGETDTVHVFAVGGDDCNCNGTADACDVSQGPDADCNENGTLDSCELAAGGVTDCDSDGVPDECQDCNGNGVGDGCDIAGGLEDLDGNGIPDTCEQAALADARGMDFNRFISFTPQTPGYPTAIRVRATKLYNTDSGDPDNAVCPPRLAPLPDLSTFNGLIGWVGPPFSAPESADSPIVDGTRFAAAPLQCCPHFTDWPARLTELGASVLDVYGPAVLPCSEYEVQVVSDACLDFSDESCYATLLTARTGRWGDIAAPFNAPGEPGFTDINAQVQKYKGILPPLKVQSMLREDWVPLTTKTGFLDIGLTVNAYKSIPYGGHVSSECPSCR
jgi:hypothetical protein